MHMSFDMVIHTDFGAFGLTQEVVRRLHERGVEWTDKLGQASPRGLWYPQDDGDDELRRDADLVAVVRELEEELKSRVENLQSWRERAEVEHGLLHGLKTVTVDITVEILDDDGSETVRVFGGTR